MKIAYKKKSVGISFYVAISICLSTIACKKNEEVKPNTSTVSVSTNDKTFFAQLKKTGDEFAKGNIWRGYNFDKTPMYLVYRDASGTPVRGYLVNPISTIAGAVKVSEADNQGLNVYRYDAMINQANTKLKAGNDAFEFNYKIEGNDYYLQAYADQDIANYEAISLATHEVFHTFQFTSAWSPNPGELQDEQNYPINADLLSYQLLLLKIAEKMPKETDQAKIKSYLEMYVALREAEMKLDPSPSKLVRFMANNQEEGEGTARYIEYAVNYRVFSDFTSKRPSFVDVNSVEITSQRQVRSTFAFGIWYSTGAAVAYMLDNQGVDIATQIQSNKNVYEVAVAHLNLTEAQKTAALNQAKVEFNWTSIQQEAARLMALR
ncbi:hypothetical protein BKI52_12170 [marine bacterium AO1-C]|nr:hypothetical protein BKI52_12170 [marine bacterium AO1-C]